MTAFDTLAAARELEAAGFGRKQAEAVAAAIRSGQGDLAANPDIASVRIELTALKGIVGFVAALDIGMALRLFGAF